MNAMPSVSCLDVMFNPLLNKKSSAAFGKIVTLKLHICLNILNKANLAHKNLALISNIISFISGQIIKAFVNMYLFILKIILYFNVNI